MRDINRRRTLEYQIAVMTAFRDGRTVETWRTLDDDAWAKILPNHQFDWDNYDYRIAPEPRRAREWKCVVVEPGGILVSVGDLVSDESPRITVREVLPEDE